MSRHDRRGGWGGMVMGLVIAAAAIGLFAPTQATHAMAVTVTLGESGSVPANDDAVQTVTQVIELDAPETSVAQTYIQVNCGTNQCGRIGWSPAWGFQEPNAARGFGNEFIRLHRGRSSSQIAQTEDGRTIHILTYVFSMRAAYGAVPRNTISYEVRDTAGTVMPLTEMTDFYNVREAESLRTTLQNLSLGQPVIVKDGETIQTATLTFVPGEASAGVATVRIGINRGRVDAANNNSSLEMGSFSCDRWFRCQEVGAYGNDLVRLNTEGGSRMEVREDGTTVVTFMWTVLPDAPTVTDNTITYFVSELDGYQTAPETATSPTFAVVEPTTPPNPPVEPVTTPGEIFPVAPAPGYNTPLYGTPGNASGTIHLSWTAVDPSIVSNFHDISPISYSIYWWRDGETEADASYLISHWPTENYDPGDALSFDLSMDPSLVDPNRPDLTPEELEDEYGYIAILNGNTYHVRIAALVPIENGGIYASTEVFSNTVTVTPGN